MDDRHFEALRDSYLSTFDVYGSVAADTHGNVTRAASMNPCTAFVIATVAADRGVMIRGVTSERTTGGQFICGTMPDGTPRVDARVVYVGPYNYFTGHTGSIWSLVASDKVYVDTRALASRGPMCSRCVSVQPR